MMGRNVAADTILIKRHKITVTGEVTRSSDQLLE